MFRLIASAQIRVESNLWSNPVADILCIHFGFTVSICSYTAFTALDLVACPLTIEREGVIPFALDTAGRNEAKGPKPVMITEHLLALERDESITT